MLSKKGAEVLQGCEAAVGRDALQGIVRLRQQLLCSQEARVADFLLEGRLKLVQPPLERARRNAERFREARDRARLFVSQMCAHY